MVWAIRWNQGPLTGNFPQGRVLVSLAGTCNGSYGTACEERMGLPWEDSGQPQNRASTGHSWAHQQCWWCLCENVFKKGQNQLCASSERGVRKHHTAIDISRSEEQEKEELEALEPRFPCSPWRDVREAGLSWRTVAHGWTHTGVVEKCVMEEVANKGFQGLPHSLSPCTTQDGKMLKDKKEKCETGWEKGIVLIFTFVSCYMKKKNLFWFPKN